MTKNQKNTVYESFRIFLKKVQELKERELMKNSFIELWKVIGSNETKEIEFSYTQPNEELFRSLCIAVRYFFLKDEGGYVFHIYNLCQRFLTNEEHKKFLILSRKMLLTGMKSFDIDITINEMECSPQFAFDTFINATFHHDPKCVEFIENLNKMEKIVFQIELDSFVFNATRHIFYLEKIVRHALEYKEIKNVPDEV